MSKPIRRNVAHLTQAERDAYIDAIKKADSTKFFSDSVSYWDKQDQIHQATHVHGQRNFAPWHRELCNRFEALLQEIDPGVALHYWDWTEDPRAASDGKGGTINLFTSTNFGSSIGRAAVPFDKLDNNNVFAGSRDATGNPADPPQSITRQVGASGGLCPPDTQILDASDGFPQNKQWEKFDDKLHGVHDTLPHDFIGGTLVNPHTSFRDPFVFLMHSNLDRIWAMWQFELGQEWRLDPNQTFGDLGADAAINEFLEPWSGTVHFGSPIKPWDPTDINNQIIKKTSKHPSVVQPACYDTLPTHVTLDSPVGGAPLKFNDIPESIETVRAVVFRLRTCHDVTLKITAGPGAPFGTPLGTVVIVPYNDGLSTFAYVWISYKGTTAGATATGSVTIHCDDTGEDWIIPITANTIKKPTVASVMVLDKSGSMGDPSGIPGKIRLDVLKEAAPKFVYLMGDDDGIGIVNFDSDAHPVMDVTKAGSLTVGVGRSNALGFISAHTNGGRTSIGDGLELGHTKLTPVTGYDHKAMIVFTDGHENEPKSISDVTSLLDERVFAIGLGRADQLDTSKLDAVTHGSGGYLLMTGDLGTDDQFRLSKYFLQILAGVKNTEIVTDPESSVVPGVKHRIPFNLTRSDFGTDVIMLSPFPDGIRFQLETPLGNIIRPSNLASFPGVKFAKGAGVHFYRATLPVPSGGKKAHEGTWYALLEADSKIFRKYLGGLREGHDNNTQAAAKVQGIPYSLSVHARSNLRMQAYLFTTGNEPGAIATLRALLTESDLPLDHLATVWVELERPDGTKANLTLSEIEPGVFQTTTPLLIPGVYQAHFKAQGSTRRGSPFTREEWRTAGVAEGADHEPSRVPPGAGNESWCRFLHCILEDPGVLRRLGLNPERFHKCLSEVCNSSNLAEGGTSIDPPR